MLGQIVTSLFSEAALFCTTLPTLGSIAILQTSLTSNISADSQGMHPPFSTL